MVDFNTQAVDTAPLVRVVENMQLQNQQQQKALAVEGAKQLEDLIDIEKLSLDRAKFRETKRRNRATETLDRGNLQERRRELTQQQLEENRDYFNEQAPGDWVRMGIVMESVAETGDGSQAADFLEMMRNKYDGDHLVPWVALEERIRDGDAASANMLVDIMIEGFNATGELELGDGENVSETDKAIDSLTQQYIDAGYAPAEASVRAANVARGLIKVETDESGRVLELNQVDGSFEVLSAPQTDRDPLEFRDRGTLWRAAEQGTGPGSLLSEVWSRTAGVVWDSQVNAPVVQARQGLRTEQNQLVRAFANNPRYAVGEQNLIRQELAIRPEVFDTAEGMKNRMIVVDRAMRRRANELRSFIADTNTAADQRNDDQTTLREIESFINVMNVPRAEMLRSIGDIDRMSSDDIRIMGQNMLEEEYNAMPLEVRIEFNRRLGGN